MADMPGDTIRPTLGRPIPMTPAEVADFDAFKLRFLREDRGLPDPPKDTDYPSWLPPQPKSYHGPQRRVGPGGRWGMPGPTGQAGPPAPPIQANPPTGVRQQYIGPQNTRGMVSPPGGFEVLKNLEGSIPYQKSRRGKRTTKKDPAGKSRPAPYFHEDKFMPGHLEGERKKTVGYGHKPGGDYPAGLSPQQAEDLLIDDVYKRMEDMRGRFNATYGDGSFGRLSPSDQWLIMETNFQTGDYYKKMAERLFWGDRRGAQRESWTNMPQFRTIGPTGYSGEMKRNYERQKFHFPEFQSSPQPPN